MQVLRSDAVFAAIRDCSLLCCIVICLVPAGIWLNKNTGAMANVLYCVCVM